MQTVWYKSDGGYPMSVMMSDAAMAELGWTCGQEITLDQTSEAIAANARAFCRDMDARRLRGESAPDTTELAAMCGASPIN